MMESKWRAATVVFTMDILSLLRYIPDVSPDMYKQIEAIVPFLKHGLFKWIAERAKSLLEKFHHLLVHFGNMGMHHEFLTCRVR
jgi:hypothetical protein